MKLLFISDLHIDNPKWSHRSLWGNNRKIWLHFVREAIERKVDALVVAGDIFDSGKPYPEAIASVADGLDLAQKANLKVIMISGNHEKHNWPKGNRHVFEIFNRPNVEIAITPRNIPIGEFQITALPYLTIPEVREIHPNSRAEDLIPLLSQEMSRQIERLSEDSDLLVGHATIDGAKYGVERELSINSSFFKEALINIQEVEDFYPLGGVFGHIHTAQKLGNKSRYIGSTYQIDFSEEGMEKGALLFEDGVYTFLPTPVELARQFYTFHANEGFEDGLTKIKEEGNNQLVRVVVPYGMSSKIDTIRGFCDELGLVVADLKIEGKRISNAKLDIGDISVVSSSPLELLLTYLETASKEKGANIPLSKIQEALSNLV